MQRRQPEDLGLVAQHRAVVAEVCIALQPPRELEGLGRPPGVAVQCQRGPEMRGREPARQAPGHDLEQVARGLRTPGTVAGQHVEPVALGHHAARVLRLGEFRQRAQPAQAALPGKIGDLDPLPARRAEKIQRIHRHPVVRLDGPAPEGETAVVQLLVQDLCDRPRKPLRVRGTGLRILQKGRQVQQRERAASDLFQAAVGIQVELAHQACHVPLRAGVQGQLRGHGLGDHVGQRRSAQRHGLRLRQLARLAPVIAGKGRLDRQRQGALQGEMRPGPRAPAAILPGRSDRPAAAA
jgi:hypothetical protein